MVIIIDRTSPTKIKLHHNFILDYLARSFFVIVVVVVVVVVVEEEEEEEEEW